MSGNNLLDDTQPNPSQHDGSFVWKATDDDLTRVLPQHIRSYGMQRSTAPDGSDLFLVYVDIGRILVQQFTDRPSAQSELNRISNTLLVN